MFVRMRALRLGFVCQCGSRLGIDFSAIRPPAKPLFLTNEPKRLPGRVSSNQLKSLSALRCPRMHATGIARASTEASPAKLEFEEGTTMVGFKKILFPTDFSRNADKALALALALAHTPRIADFDGG